MKKIWITGSSGHIGTALMELLDCMEYEIFATDVEEVDISDLGAVSQFMKVNRPDVVINCAGIKKTEYCEEHVDEAFKVNAIGVRNIALAANEIYAKVIQLSTDDVFDQESDVPYNEFDRTHPKSVYGKSKEAGERFLTQLCSRFVIIRSSWVYGIGRDFLDKVLNNVGQVPYMEVPDNQYATPTSAAEISKVIKHFIDHDEYGLYHVVCKGSCSRYEYAKAILEILGKEDQMEIRPVTYQDMKRPTYSVLDNMMLRLTGIEEPKEWREALEEYLRKTGGVE